MKLNVDVELNPTYTIKPVMTTTGRGKSKKEVLKCIQSVVYFNKGIAVKGEISKKDIDESIPQLEMFGVDFYGEFIGCFISEMIIKVNEMFGTYLTHKDFDDFCDEHKDTFVRFKNELKTMVDSYR